MPFLMSSSPNPLGGDELSPIPSSIDSSSIADQESLIANPKNLKAEKVRVLVRKKLRISGGSAEKQDMESRIGARGIERESVGSGRGKMVFSWGAEGGGEEREGGIVETLVECSRREKERV